MLRTLTLIWLTTLLGGCPEHEHEHEHDVLASLDTVGVADVGAGDQAPFPGDVAEVPDATPDGAQEVGDAATELAPDVTPDVIPEVPDTATELAPDVTPDGFEEVEDAVADAAPDATPDVVAETVADVGPDTDTDTDTDTGPVVCTEPASLAPTDDDQVAQGTSYTVQPTVLAGAVVKWRKSYGPDEVVVDAQNGALSWSIPATLPSESFHLGVRGTDACGNMVEDVWVLTVGDGNVLRVGPSEAFAEIQPALAAAVSGDTILVTPGTYEGASNSLNSNPTPTAMPPSGTANAFTTVISAEPGGAILVDRVVWTGKWGEFHHVALKGFVANMGVGIQTGFDNAPRPHHIKIVDVASEAEIGIAHADDVLVEGCYVYGDGRYKLSTYKSNRVVFRRCVVRLDHAPLSGQTNPFGSCVAYSSDDVVFQNVIDVDSNQAEAYPDGEQTGAFSVPTTAGASNRIIYARSIVLNNALKLGSYDSTNGVADVRYEDLIAWDINTFVGLPDLTHGFGSAVFDHATFGAIESDGDVAGITQAYFNGWGGHWDEIKNSAFADIDGPLFYQFEALSFNAFEDTDPYTATAPDEMPETFLFTSIVGNALTYLPRIEAGSSLSGAAGDGGDIGATVMNFRGRSGTFFGEQGWDDATDTSMWPFPHEERIASHMRAYTFEGNLQSGKYVEVTGNRGFTQEKTALDGGPQTLTSYIWEYLGAPCPPQVCRP